MFTKEHGKAEQSATTVLALPPMHSRSQCSPSCPIRTSAAAHQNQPDGSYVAAHDRRALLCYWLHVLGPKRVFS